LKSLEVLITVRIFQANISFIVISVLSFHLGINVAEEVEDLGRWSQLREFLLWQIQVPPQTAQNVTNKQLQAVILKHHIPVPFHHGLK